MPSERAGQAAWPLVRGVTDLVVGGDHEEPVSNPGLYHRNAAGRAQRAEDLDRAAVARVDGEQAAALVHALAGHRGVLAVDGHRLRCGRPVGRLRHGQDVGDAPGLPALGVDRGQRRVDLQGGDLALPAASRGRHPGW